MESRTRLKASLYCSISGYLNQAVIQIEVLKNITAALKEGKYTGNIGVPEKLVLVGHSFGSVISSAIVADDPTVADGLILTGMLVTARVHNFY